MPQDGWFDKGRRWTQAERIAHSANYPADDPYTPQMLKAMFKPSERTYISPTMLASCPRQETIKRHVNYQEYPNHAWVRTFGTLLHLAMEKIAKNEDEALLEIHLEVELSWPDGRTTIFQGTADKVVPSQRLLIDYKTVPEPITGKDAKEQSKIRGWTAQLSVYRWMLHLNGIDVDRAVLQQISKKEPHRLELEMWPLDETEAYVFSRAERFLGVFDGTYNLDNLPPMLDPDLDQELIWLCNSSWCPVKYHCFKYRDQGK